MQVLRLVLAVFSVTAIIFVAGISAGTVPAVYHWLDNTGVIRGRETDLVIGVFGLPICVIISIVSVPFFTKAWSAASASPTSAGASFALAHFPLILMLAWPFNWIVGILYDRAIHSIVLTVAIYATVLLGCFFITGMLFRSMATQRRFVVIMNMSVYALALIYLWLLHTSGA